MNPDIMNHETKCQKVFCPTFEHIFNYLNLVNIINQPKQIFVMCGTNNLHRNSVNKEQFENKFVEVLVALETCFPTAKFIISSLLPRKEGAVNSILKVLNDFILGCCATSKKYLFMYNVNINRNQLIDDKHIDADGFKTLLSNIRYTLFGKLPKTRR